jgi:hypothetical protein
MDERIRINLECSDSGKKLSPLELEIYAALGSNSEVPVETDMTLSGPNGSGIRKHIAFWPISERVPDEAAELSQNWVEFRWRICKNAPMSLKDAVNYMSNKRNGEEEV